MNQKDLRATIVLGMGSLINQAIFCLSTYKALQCAAVLVDIKKCWYIFFYLHVLVKDEWPNNNVTSALFMGHWSHCCLNISRPLEWDRWASKWDTFHGAMP